MQAAFGLAAFTPPPLPKFEAGSWQSGVPTTYFPRLVALNFEHQLFGLFKWGSPEALKSLGKPGAARRATSTNGPAPKPGMCLEAFCVLRNVPRVFSFVFWEAHYILVKKRGTLSCFSRFSLRHLLFRGKLRNISQREANVNPGLINPWLMNRGVNPPVSGDSDHFWRGTPPPPE